ncbi:DNA repair protein RecO [Paenibacillus flagellatus]|uniref:DNA repair protein RecO n=1 Tax=Paenibacillus flagellatus TaxID=2211139 RepID=A0A2V5JYX3_9BACL|nr:DNA repair protein RecO [Paenibacillus flagellatus]PYI51951.1 DNA repair protein RecO [Paenibacillus flagellatus]
MLVRVEAIVIRSMDYGEGNKILTLFSKEAGKIGVMARGAKKLKSRHTAIAQPFTHGEFVLFRTGQQMGSLNAGEIWNAYHRLREDLNKAAYASYLMELTEKTVGDNEPNASLFEQLKGSLDAMDEGKDPQIVLHIYEMKMLAIAGYRPVLDECVSCGAKDGPMWLSVSMGGTVCGRCRSADVSAIPLPEGTLKLLRLFLGMDVRRLGRTEVKESTKSQLKQCIRQLLDAHLDVKWKARHFLDQMEKYGL